MNQSKTKKPVGFFASSTKRRKSLFGLAIITALLILITGVVLAAPIILIDDNGPDDYPGQKDLNIMSVDYAANSENPAILPVSWNWDDVDWSGNNTGDACSLFDTNGDGLANYSLCVTIGGSPAAYKSTRLYSCGNGAADRCDQPNQLITPFTSTCTATRAANSDPFGVAGSPYYAASHVTGNTCSGTPACYTEDMVANCEIKLADFGTATDAFLINVCSYPSEIPNSAPSECVVTPNNGYLTLVKVADPNDGTAFTFNASTAAQDGKTSWTINGSGSVQLISYPPGTTYDLSEAVPAGWKLDSADCKIQTSTPTQTGTWSGNTITDFEIRSGLETICTFYDSPQQGSITVIKNVVNDNGGSSVPGDFTIYLGDSAGITFPGSSAGTKYTFDAGYAFNVTESGPAGYAPSFAGDCSGMIESGVDKVCTITNDDQQAYITVTKVVFNNNGGTAAPDDFLLTLEGSAVTSGVAVPVNPGTYTAGETLLPGYDFTGFSGDCDTNGDVTVALGQSKTCTLTNDDQQAFITVTKVVVNDNGGTAQPNDFKLTLNGSAVSSGVAVPVAPGTYTAAETLLPGYTFTGFSGDCNDSGVVTVALGESKSCTLTNDDQQAYITVVKNVTNDNGGAALPDDFLLTLDGKSVKSGVAVPVNPGMHTAAETLLPGYSFTGFSGDCNSNGVVTVALGQSKTCTLTNDDQQAFITVTKVVVNDNGGAAQPNDFKLTLEGSAVTSGVAVPVAPGTYTAGETQLSGYTFTGFTGDCDSNGDVTVALGQSKTCTLTNDDQQAFITVIKTVINNNGGAALPDDFKLTLEGSAVTSGIAVPVNPGTYTAAETQLPGYTFTGFSGDCNNSGDVTVALGQSKTCTLTNDDQQAHITVVKKVINDDGGAAAPDDFKLTLEGSAVTSGVAVPVNPGTYTAGETQLSGYTFEGYSGACDANGDVTVALGESKTCTLTNNDQQAYITIVKVVTNNNGGTAKPDDFKLTLEGSPVTSGVAVPVDPGTYTAGETLLSGYSFTGFSGDCDTNGDVTVALGQSKTCTLTNDDQQAFITVVKNVINNNGGAAQPNDFKLTLEGSPVTSGVAVPVNPGTYTAGETLLPGYTFTGFTGGCDSNGDVTVALGQSKTCTLTNDDQQAFITVTKVVVNDNGGTAQPNDFKLTLNGSAVSSGVAVPVAPGTYTAAETLLPGYTFTGFTGDCNSGGVVTVALGESKSCTLTNDDQQAFITVIKKVINNNGGAALPDAFKLTLEGSPVLSSVAVPVNPGTYTAGETQLSGYTFTGFTGDCDSNGDVTVALGESKSCTLTNDDQQAYITVIKKVINDNGGTAKPDDFKLTLEGSAVTSGVAVPVDPGTYTAGETLLSGYTFTGFTGDCDSNGDVTVALGQSKTCTLTNNDQQAYITVVKKVNNDNGGAALPDDFKLTLEGSAVTSGIAVPVNPGTYTAAETQLPGYTFTGFSGDCDTNGDVTVALGESKTCTLTNDDQQAYITVTKVVVNNNGGKAAPNDFKLTLNGNPVLSGVKIPVNPGMYTAAETQLAGYTFTSFSGDCDNAGKITIALGQSKSCTLTNDDQQAYITVVKIVVNNYGTPADPDDFLLTLDGNSVKSGVSVPVNPGTYTAGETQLLGYTFDGFGGSCNSSGQITVSLGESKTCTLTNRLVYWAFTPGFWKNHTAASPSGHDAWPYTAYLPSQKLYEVFNPAYMGEKPRGSNTPLKNYTLLQALSFKGGTDVVGAKQILLRAGVAALLNASFHETFDMAGVHPAAEITPEGKLINPITKQVYYPYSTAKIIELVNAALASNDKGQILTLAVELDDYNNGDHYINWNWPVPVPEP